MFVQNIDNEGGVMVAGVGEYRELPGPKAQVLFEELKECGITTVQNSLVFLEKEYFRKLVMKDVDGNYYLDFFAGAGVSNLGHRNRDIHDAVKLQLSRGAWQYDESVFPNTLALELRQRLARLTPGSHKKKVFLCNSGTEAVEAALKLAFSKRPERKRVIAFKGAFHGRTGYSLQLHGSRGVHKRQYPSAYPVHYYPFPSYGGMVDNVFNDDGSVFDASDINAVILELVQGEGGIHVACDREIRRLESWCRENDILLIVDEVQTGIGRTGTFFASEQYGITPDIITIAKALSFGVAPAGAVVARADLDFDDMGRHANTNGGNMVACAAALAGLDVLEKDPTILEKVVEHGNYMHKELSTLARRVKERGKGITLAMPRGLGLMRGIDVGSLPFIHNKEERIALSQDLRDKVVEEAAKRGLIIEGAGVAAIRFTPPLTVTKENIDLALKIFEEAVYAAAHSTF